MGLLGIAKGFGKVIGGIVEGDVKEIAKGIGKIITGAVTIKGGGEDETSDFLD